LHLSVVPGLGWRPAFSSKDSLQACPSELVRQKMGPEWPGVKARRPEATQGALCLSTWALPETFRLMTSSDGWFSESNQGFTLSPCKRSQGQALATLLRGGGAFEGLTADTTPLTPALFLLAAAPSQAHCFHLCTRLGLHAHSTAAQQGARATLMQDRRRQERLSQKHVVCCGVLATQQAAAFGSCHPAIGHRILAPPSPLAELLAVGTCRQGWAHRNSAPVSTAAQAGPASCSSSWHKLRACHRQACAWSCSLHQVLFAGFVWREAYYLHSQTQHGLQLDQQA